MIKSKNELIERRRKRIRRKKTFFLIVLLIAILITLCIKLPYFNIKNIVVSKNKTISSNEIIKESGIVKNTNIFYLNVSKSETNILTDPYVLKVDVTRKLPNLVEIVVTERSAAFYVLNDKKFYIIDRNGILLEIRDNINNLKLINLQGINVSKAQIGNVIPCDDSRKIDAIGTITDIILDNTKFKNISKVDISDSINIQVYYNDMCIYLGTGNNLLSKLNKAINIINSQNLAASKGYVDVSFNGNPVFCVQK